MTMLVKTLRRWWEKWLRWPYGAAMIGMWVLASVVRVWWVSVIAGAMFGVSVVISIAYAVLIGRILRDMRRSKREADQRLAEIIARRARERT